MTFLAGRDLGTAIAEIGGAQQMFLIADRNVIQTRPATTNQTSRFTVGLDRKSVV